MTGERVAITGYGAVSGFGWGVAPFRDGVFSGETAIREVRRFDTRDYRTHYASEAGGAAPPGAPGARRDTLADRFALFAAAEALAAAGLPERLDARAAGLFFGSSTGGMLESETFFDELDRESGRQARIGRLVAQQPTGPGDAVARRHGIGGPVSTIASACASATLALGAALDALRSGEIDLALVGGADSLCRLTFAGFNSLRAVDPGACRPFRREREGMSIGEGAGVLVLERAEHAAARGAAPRGWLAGAGASCDAHHMTAPDPEGDGIARAVADALADAALDAGAVDFVNLHGTGTPANDAAEAKMLARIFGERVARLPATSTKAAVGHYLGAAGAIEAVATLLCLEAGAVHPTPGVGTLDPAAPVDLVVGAPRAVAGARVALSTNLAFGGANAAAIFLGREAT
ncbi:MAG: beta-ketoacyl-[acyl-carrier-protein] synthase family protein [Holophagales bacterium]|nr:beta-ketoacyl-[acyl-carrier-protein] synthase family protein [Holophagales bacterium]